MTRGAPIQASDFASDSTFVTLANTKLLPLVNASIEASTWLGHFYSIYTDPPTNSILANPQPAYDFSGTSANWLSELNRIRADYWNLIFGNSNFTYGSAPTPINSDLYLNPDNIVSGPWVVGVNDPVTFPGANGTLLCNQTFSLEADPAYGYYSQDTLCLFSNVEFWCDSLQSLNVTGIMQAEYIQPDSSDSDNTRTLALKMLSTVDGEIVLSFILTIGGSPSPTAASLGFTASAGTTQISETSPGTYAAQVIVPLVAGSEIDITIYWTAPSGCTLGSSPSTADGGPYMSAQMTFLNVIDSIPASGLHPTTSLKRIKCTPSPASALPHLTLVKQSGDFSIPSAGLGLPFNYSAIAGAIYGAVSYILSDPTIQGVWVANTLPVPGNNVFIDQDIPPYVSGEADMFGTIVAVSDWVANNSLPDLDNSPTEQYDNTEPILASSMRQQALLQNGYHYIIPFWSGTTTYSYEGTATAPNGDLYYSLQSGNLNHPLTDPAWWAFLVPASENSSEPKYNLISQSEQCQPAQWAVKRDTDFVPFNFGFNPNDEEQIYSSQAIPAGTFNYYSVPLVGSNAVGIKIRLVAAGSEKLGWQNGVFSYGTAPPDGLTISVGKSGGDGYDFVSENNAVTIPNDGGRGYIVTSKLAGGIIIAIQNTTDSDLTYDLVIEVDTVLNPQRQYFPACYECFSYCLDGTPPGTMDAYGVNKPIPQNGYCIFKVRATRLPVKNAAGIAITPSGGDEINVVLGQNRLAFDGTLKFAPFLAGQVEGGAGDTDIGAGDDGQSGQGAGGAAGGVFNIIIPADARDSGDVEVFIPVLGGNELVWQCGEGVIVEAWANWQPVFFAGIYGYYENYDTSLASFDAMAFQYCAAFSNWYDEFFSNYTAISEPQVARTQFPISVELVNDLNACLELIA